MAERVQIGTQLLNEASAQPGPYGKYLVTEYRVGYQFRPSVG